MRNDPTNATQTRLGPLGIVQNPAAELVELDRIRSCGERSDGFVALHRRGDRPVAIREGGGSTIDRHRIDNRSDSDRYFSLLVDLAGLYRSALLVRLLRLLLHERREWTVDELAARADAPYPTVAKEVRRLENAGVVEVSTDGRTKLLTAAWSEPAVRSLARMLKAAGLGPLPAPEGGDDMAKKKDKKKKGKKKK